MLAFRTVVIEAHPHAEQKNSICQIVEIHGGSAEAMRVQVPFVLSRAELWSHGIQSPSASSQNTIVFTRIVLIQSLVYG